MYLYAYYDAPIARMLIAARDGAIAKAAFVDQKYYPRVVSDWREAPDDHVIGACVEELAAYFAGARTTFDVPLAAEGTPFQRAIWTAISSVPYGATISYGELARRAGFPGEARAAGTATGRNPIGIIVPCHRIVGANGALTGYAGGLEKKRALLDLEAGTPALLAVRR